MKSSLSELQLKVSYRSGRDAMVGDFYNPALSIATEYRRAVGYFTSSGLAIAARGVASLVARGGKMRLIASPHLEEGDIAALRSATDDPEDVLRKILDRNLVEIEDFLVKQRLNALAWLIASGALEVKLAIRLNESGNISRGLYHEKIGIFSDEQGNHIAFAGSSNETAGGLLDNFESIKVFWSWDDSQGRVEEEISNFDAMWCNQTAGLRVVEFTTISAELLERYKLPTPPPADVEVPSGEPKTLPSSAPGAIPSWLDLRDYQRLGLEAWKTAGGKGILAMATGSGKTITALYLACRIFEKTTPLVVIVVCPYVNLARQWIEEMRKFNLDPIECFRGRQFWERPLQERYAALSAGVTKILPMVVVNRTFLSPAFQEMLRPERIAHLLIADEVHNLGSPNLKIRLNPKIRYRLGLSATPVRQGDEEGTQAIFDYFGDVVYEFPIKKAIERDVLCRYFYHPVLVRLTDDETSDYWNLTIEIGRAMGREDGDEMSLRLKHLLLKRARLIGSAAEKLPALKRTIDGIGKTISKALVYCGDGSVETDDEEMTRQVVAACKVLGDECGLRVRKFTCDESEQEREQILEGLQAGRLDCVVAIRCLDEGIDVPDARLGFLLASSQNPRQFIQRRGRLLRKAPGKDFAHIWDFIIDPPDFAGCDDDSAFNVERRLFQRELRRIVEFCETAENGTSAINLLHDLRRRYNLLSSS